MGIAKKDLLYVVIGWVLTIFSVVMLYRQGVTRSFFHQDDVIELSVIADWKGWSTLGHMNNEHLNITFWPLLRTQWILFGINYLPYLTLNIFFHLVVLVLIFLTTYRLTESVLWSSIPVWGMVINSNWFTVVWWITGQMFFLTTIFALITYCVILKIRDKPKTTWLYPLLYIVSVLPGLSWGIGLSWPTWPLLIFGINYINRRVNKIGSVLIAAQLTLIVIYVSLVGSNLGVHTDPKTWFSNPLAIISFVVVGISNTVVGRWLWPPENLEVRVLFLLIMLTLFVISKPWRKIMDRNIIFGLMVTIGSFTTFAIPRWRFGIGHAMANYYAYFPLPFLLIAVAVFLSKYNCSGWRRALLLSIFLIHIPLSWIGFESWARDWVVRPQQTRAYFQEIDSTLPGSCLNNRYLPEFIVPQNIWRIDFLWPVFKKDFDPFCIDK
ncbi:TPA: hypothetical protein DIU27_00475 [Candidatus Collierbacteria bacterium]|uniref:Glycosyltransferase RgtA/B/C/D-like domain-containing protein n=1 Tax=Candidatus Collierbacteria bacterium GW2011_GWB2_44_22 TaxID=1618387 RepID=A0A0G1K5P2_9BACT|nr:MAG: hypothetical protein UW31_C0005G0107 [Candidatus Collierbacteria bacterium GW2011_GWA2_44_13]KKT51049.1 MAG: hypothetical protein UW42_C0008G0011 [Candidatus Collierbacteria bacterium GW2011_GWB1_44_197]KKT51597.1 MAG: hypothetical protein UW44_C0010G0035 [Candidatus Collierbacteria bacterium GW2011_GWB2_44_22]KKT63048.1 MAG: hypothetical protein UW56_C0002G0033 [Candidatus Collierbacteria bacterium GW2011_GWD1_44_27]KKT66437.1 MAG: hypothetical protein UW58_C0008G0030 [Candidatus Colli